MSRWVRCLNCKMRVRASSIAQLEHQACGKCKHLLKGEGKLTQRAKRSPVPYSG